MATARRRTIGLASTDVSGVRVPCCGVGGVGRVGMVQTRHWPPDEARITLKKVIAESPTGAY